MYAGRNFSENRIISRISIHKIISESVQIKMSKIQIKNAPTKHHLLVSHLLVSSLVSERLHLTNIAERLLVL